MRIQQHGRFIIEGRFQTVRYTNMVGFLLKTDVIVTVFLAVVMSVLFVNILALALHIIMKTYMYIKDIR